MVATTHPSAYIVLLRNYVITDSLCGCVILARLGTFAAFCVFFSSLPGKLEVCD